MRQPLLRRSGRRPKCPLPGSGSTLPIGIKRTSTIVGLQTLDVLMLRSTTYQRLEWEIEGMNLACTYLEGPQGFVGHWVRAENKEWMKVWADKRGQLYSSVRAPKTSKAQWHTQQWSEHWLVGSHIGIKQWKGRIERWSEFILTRRLNPGVGEILREYN